MNKKLACFLVALTATSGAYAHDCECEKQNKDNECRFSGLEHHFNCS